MEGKTEILNLISLNDTFPKLPSDYINRDAFIDNIITNFEEYDILFINGNEGVGKTTLLADFVKLNQFNAISYFVKLSDQYTYSIDSLKYNLSQQIFFYSTTEYPNDEIETDEKFSNLQLKLRRKIRRETKPLYFVFDGFDQIEKTDLIILKNIFQSLPWGQAKFLFTGEQSKLDILIPPKIKHKAIELINFGIRETADYFKEFKPNQKEVEEIHKIASKGLPSKLSQIKRLCKRYSSIKKFLQNDISEDTDLFEMDWQAVSHNKMHDVIIGIIAFADSKYKPEEIAKIANTNKKNVEKLINNINFIQLENEKACFVSQKHNSYAQKKLKSIENEVLNLLIEYYENNTNDEDSIYNLPNLYQKSKKWNELTKLLSIKAFIEYVKKYETIGNVKKQLNYGINASKHIQGENDFIGDFLRYTLHKSSFLELEKYEMWDSEVEARIVLNDYPKAFSIANSVLLKEDRLKLLAILSKQRKIKNLPEDKILQQQIKELYKQIDFKPIKDKGLEIANILVYSDFVLAIELVEKLTDSNAGKNSIEYAFAYLSLFAHKVITKTKTEHIDLDLINSKIKDNGIKSLLKAFMFLSEEYNSNSIIENAKMLKNTSRKIFLLRYWIITNKKQNDIYKVIEYAINQIIKSSTEEVPNASVLADIASPLPHIKNKEIVFDLVKLFDSQKNTIKTPTKDFIKLQLTIAEALNRFNKKEAKERIFEIFYFIDEEIADLSIKTDALSLLWNKLIQIDIDNSIEKEIFSQETIEKHIEKNINLLLKETAFHYRMVEFVIKTIVAKKPKFIFNIIPKINILERRDAAYRISAIHYIFGQDIDKLDFKTIDLFYNKITSKSFKDEILYSLIEKYLNNKEKSIPYIPKLLKYKDFIYNITDIDEKCSSLINLITVLNYNKSKYKSLLSDIENKLLNMWKHIDVNWKKIEIAFVIARDIANYSEKLAKEYLDYASSLKEKEAIYSFSILNTYKQSVNLCIKAFGGLLSDKNELEEELKLLEEIINLINSDGERLKLWNKVALQLYSAEKQDTFNKVVKNNIIPYLSNLNSIDVGYRAHVLLEISPTLFYNSQTLFFNIHKELPIDVQDTAINNICEHIFTRTPLDEPNEETDDGYKLDYTDYINLCTLFNKIENDFLLFHFIKKSVKSLEKNKFNIPFEQKNEIIRRLDELIDNKLPNKETGIKHEGYSIIAKGALLSINNYDKEKWNELIKKARKIDNLSDKALVLIILTELMKSKSKIRKIELLEEAFNYAKNISSFYDKTNRFDASWEVWKDIDKGKLRQHLKIAYEDLLQNSENNFNNLKNIIDVAQQHDEKLAESLITLTDQDPARRRLKKPLQKRIEINKQIKKASSNFNMLAELTPEQFDRVFNNNLAQLNSGRYTSKNVADTTQILETISEMPLSDAYNSLVFFIKNASIKYSGKNFKKLQTIFQATYENAKLVAIFSAENIKKMKNMFDYKLENFSTETMFRQGDRNKYLEYIKNWIEKHSDDELIYIDPYFSYKELDFLKTVLEANPKCYVTILTCQKEKELTEQETKDKYNDHWNKISTENPPENRILIVSGDDNKKCPIHDRWLITNNFHTGIHLNSHNSIGNKETQIVNLSEKEIIDVKNTVINDYIYRKRTKVSGYNLKYFDFSMEVN